MKLFVKGVGLNTSTFTYKRVELATGKGLGKHLYGSLKPVSSFKFAKTLRTREPSSFIGSIKDMKDSLDIFINSLTDMAKTLYNDTLDQVKDCWNCNKCMTLREHNTKCVKTLQTKK